jgi:hypothetical protein
MRKKPSKGQFVPKNPQKYLGKNIDNIIYRSSWELTMMLTLDQHPNVLAWMSEALPSNHVHNGLSGIPYLNPFTGKQTLYVPDFFVIYIDKSNKQHVEVMEIKPLDELPPVLSRFKGKVSKLKEARQIINAAKYQSAIKFCSQRNWYFRIVTEKDLFAWSSGAR